MKKQGSSDKFDLSSGKSPSPERRKSVHFGSEITSRPVASLKRLKSDNTTPVKDLAPSSGSSNFLEIPSLDKKSSTNAVAIQRQKATTMKKVKPQFSDINIEETYDDQSSNEEALDIGMRRQSILP